jgi:hypothetical protein
LKNFALLEGLVISDGLTGGERKVLSGTLLLDGSEVLFVSLRVILLLGLSGGFGSSFSGLLRGDGDFCGSSLFSNVVRSFISTPVVLSTATLGDLLSASATAVAVELALLGLRGLSSSSGGSSYCATTATSGRLLASTSTAGGCLALVPRLILRGGFGSLVIEEVERVLGANAVLGTHRISIVNLVQRG